VTSRRATNERTEKCPEPEGSVMEDYIKTTCPNCGGDAEWNSDSNIDCDECGEIVSSVVDSGPYVVEHRLDGELVNRVQLEEKR
jgi:endogenous inhibitor of DNA gyrase (YacG/DUF329 family)